MNRDYNKVSSEYSKLVSSLVKEKQPLSTFSLVSASDRQAGRRKKNVRLVE